MATPQYVAIYARISQDRDHTGLGIERQLKDCRSEVKKRGWSKAVEYVDDDLSASGYSAKIRPNYVRLLSDIEAGSVTAVVVWHLDRLHRKPIELEDFVTTCQRAGLTEVVTLHGGFDLGTGDGLLVARLMAAVAANESDAKSRRLKRKFQELAEAGKPRGGAPSFGFEADHVTIQPNEAKIIRQLAKRCLAGESIMSMVRWLNDSEIPSPRGFTEWRTSTVRRLLLSPTIYGMRIHQGQIIGKAIWKPIISQSDGEAIRAILTDPERRTNRTPRRYLLSGLCRCSSCGATLISKPSRGQRRYTCVKGLGRPGCGGRAINADNLEEVLIRSILIRLDSDALESAMNKHQDSNPQIVELNDQITKDVQRLEELSILWSDSQITSIEWKAARDRLDTRLAQNKKLLNGIRGNREVSALIGNASTLKREIRTLPLSRQVTIVKMLVDHILIKPALKRGQGSFELDRVEIVWKF